MSDASTTGEVRGLARFIEREVDEARLERQWSAIAARAGGRRLSWVWARYAAIAAVALVVGLVARGRLAASPPSSWDGAKLATGAAPVTVEVEGAAIRLGAESRLSVAEIGADRVTLALEHGEVALDVPHVAGRSWLVRAGRFDVRVVGTRFVVRRTPRPGHEDAVSVEVERGVVEVSSNGGAPDAVHTLTAGESWSASGPIAVDAPAAHEPADMATPPSATPAAAETPSEIATAAPPPAAPPPPAAAPGWEDLARAKKYKEAYAALGAAGFAEALDRSGPEKLFRIAEVARAAGHLRDAERAFDTLRRRHRGDARAGLAAFELGRLRLDSLGNPAGAAEALGDAIALSPGAAFREDAEARRVHALHALGNTAACGKARDAYLSRYPSGAHAAIVRTLCSTR